MKMSTVERSIQPSAATDRIKNEEFRPILVTKQQAARLLAVSVRTVDNLIAQKQLAFRKLGKRTLIPYSAIAQLARHDVPVISGRRLAS